MIPNNVCMFNIYPCTLFVCVYVVYIYFIYIAIDEQVLNHTKTIQSTFKQLHQLLTKREIVLIKKLNDIANEKKSKLDQLSKILNKTTNSSQQVN